MRGRIQAQFGIALLVVTAMLCGVSGSGSRAQFEVSVREYGRYSGELGELSLRDGVRFHGEPPDRLGPTDRTPDVPCEIGERFGGFFEVAYRGSEREVPELQVHWSHPPISEPAGTPPRTHTEYSGRWDLPRRGTALVFVGWVLSHPAELTGGVWSVSLLHGKQVLSTMAFRTTGCPSGEARAN